MFAYIKGVLEEIHPQKVVIDINGLGYEVKVSSSIIERLPEKKTIVKLYTYLNVREDIQELYGFYDREEKAIFEKLITVSGIGPKLSIAILSALTPTQIALALVTNDIKTLCLAPGVGKKTAQRMILELKDKIDEESLIDRDNEGESTTHSGLSSANEVIEALIALGYQSQEALDAFNRIENKDQDVSSLIKSSLKLMDKN